jgi:hypothetical protein
MKQKIWLGVAGAMTAILLSSIFVPYWFAIEGVFTDIRLKLKSPATLSQKIKVFSVVQNKIKEEGNSKKPFEYKSLYKKLIKQGAKAVAVYDTDDISKIEMEWLQESSPLKLVRSMEGTLEGEWIKTDLDNIALGEKNGFTKISSWVYFLSKKIIEWPVSITEYSAHANVYSDVFGAPRKIPLWLESNEKLVPAFGFQAWKQYLAPNVLEIEVLSSRVKLKGKSLNLSIPTDQNVMGVVEALQKIDMRLQSNLLKLNEAISKTDVIDKLVLVGVFNSETREEEKIAFNYQIALANSLVQGSFLKEAHKSTVHSLSLVLGLLAAALVNLKNRAKSYIVMVFQIATYLVINILCFNAGLILPTLTPILSIVLSVIAVGKFHPEQAI